MHSSSRGLQRVVWRQTLLGAIEVRRKRDIFTPLLSRFLGLPMGYFSFKSRFCGLRGRLQGGQNVEDMAFSVAEVERNFAGGNAFHTASFA